MEQQMHETVVTREAVAPRQTAVGSLGAALGGGVAFIMAIVGLAGAYPTWMAGIGVVVVGLALVVGGGTIGTRYTRLLVGRTDGYAVGAVGGGMVLEAMCGIAAVALGVIALFGVEPAILLPVALIVIATALVVASGAIYLLDATLVRPAAEDALRRATHEAVMAAMGAEILVGLTSGVLGVLALTGVSPLVLVLAALLTIGTSVLFSGTTLAGRIFSARP